MRKMKETTLLSQMLKSQSRSILSARPSCSSRIYQLETNLRSRSWKSPTSLSLSTRCQGLHRGPSNKAVSRRICPRILRSWRAMKMTVSTIQQTVIASARVTLLMWPMKVSRSTIQCKSSCRKLITIGQMTPPWCFRWQLIMTQGRQEASQISCKTRTLQHKLVASRSNISQILNVPP